MATHSEAHEFTGEFEFCPSCGSILPLPGHEQFVSCQTCSYKVDVRDFDGIEVHSSIVFNKRQIRSSEKSATSNLLDGPRVERKCSQCGNDSMIYHTKQTRSADEGQTVFYLCPKCKFQESEFS
ncbi:DNA-directed RNA polymerase I subunit RPA12-like [Saccoglossus kowalevskii]|uniref:DNA-directed RNA polymerase subunit n=1 Tax=Saccoglossus kowalevskii TaxID=10224 RepID=A0ABM0MMQ5_SACKO|nr:PREDICTED: DNA-directed RNA polymerase I subunit RPA12-like [Saccoglossus kowalevskii]